MRHPSGVRMRLKDLSVLSVLAAVCGTLLLPASSASADTTGLSLPISSFDGMAVDSAHDHLFFAETNSIVVTDFKGNQVTTITGLNNPADMQVSSDGSTLYFTSNGSVDAYSTTTLTQTAGYSLPAGDTLYAIALQSGDLWVSYTDTTETTTPQKGAIGYFDLSASSPSFTADSAAGTWMSAPYVTADPSDSGVMLLIAADSSQLDAATFNTSSNEIIDQQKAFIDDGLPIGGAAVLPGGQQFVFSQYPGSVYVYNTSNLSGTASYNTSNPLGGAQSLGPNAFAVGPDGAMAIGQSQQPSDPSVHVFQAGSTATSINTYSLGTLTGNGLAWSADGSKLFAVTQQTSTSSSAITYDLNVLDNPTLIQTGVGLNVPATGVARSSISITGYLMYQPEAGTEPPPVGTPLTVTRTLSGSTAAPETFNVTTDANGSFSITDTPPVSGSYAYTISYSGGGGYAPSSYSRTMQVTPSTTSLSLGTSASSVGYKGGVTVTATLGKTDTNRSVSLYETPSGGSKKLIETGTVNSSGQLAVTEHPATSTAYTASFSGDPAYGSATTSAKTVNVYASVWAGLGNYYTSKSSGGNTYRLFHRTTSLKDSTSVTPNKHGECVKLEYQRDTSSGWKAWTTTRCSYLNSSSKATITAGLGGETVGSKYRVRVDYVRSSTDTANLSAQSGWQYFIVEK